jgi:hypothetical protein
LATLPIVDKIGSLGSLGSLGRFPDFKRESLAALLLATLPSWQPCQISLGSLDFWQP